MIKIEKQFEDSFKVPFNFIENNEKLRKIKKIEETIQIQRK